MPLNLLRQVLMRENGLQYNEKGVVKSIKVSVINTLEIGDIYGFILDTLFMLWLRTKRVKDMLLPDYANSANQEIMLLHDDLLKFLNQNDITPVWNTN